MSEQDISAEVEELRQQLARQAAEASAACQERGARCQGLEAEAADLRERLATAEDETTRLCKELTIASSLVPSADWLKMLALAEHPVGPANCTDCPFWNSSTGRCEDQCDEVDIWATVLAANIRAWRGDGDGREEWGGESDGD